MADEIENNEPEVEMADEVQTEPEVEAEAPMEEPADEPQDEPEEEPAPKPKRTRRKAAPKPVVEPVIEDEVPAEETPSEDEAPAEEVTETEDQDDDESTEDEALENELSAVLSRLEAIEALLSQSQGVTEEGEAAGLLDRAEKAERSLLAFKFGVRYGLPEELAERLQGDDEESLEEDAKKLSALMGSGSGGLGKGGLDPNEETFDAKAVARAYRKAHGGR